MALHVGHNCNPWDDCDVCGAKIEPPYRQRGGQERTKENKADPAPVAPLAPVEPSTERRIVGGGEE